MHGVEHGILDGLVRKNGKDRMQHIIWSFWGQAWRLGACGITCITLIFVKTSMDRGKTTSLIQFTTPDCHDAGASSVKFKSVCWII